MTIPVFMKTFNEAVLDEQLAEIRPAFKVVGDDGYEDCEYLPREDGGESYTFPSGAKVDHGIKDEPVSRLDVGELQSLCFGGGIRNLSTSLFTCYPTLQALILSNNRLATLPEEIGTLQNLVLLDVSGNEMRALPNSLCRTSVKELYLQNNKLTVIPYSYSTLPFTVFELENNPLSPDFALAYQKGLPEFMSFLLRKHANGVGCPHRPWVINRPIPFSLQLHTFTAMCYNLLCDKYTTQAMYPQCPDHAMKWSYRRDLLLKELDDFKGDILALQEVETEQYHDTFLPHLQKLGYDGTFYRKTRALTMHANEAKGVDGCAIFWKTSKFELEESFNLEFSPLAIKYSEKNEEMINRVMPKDNVALVAILKLVKDPADELVEGVMHGTNYEIPLVVCTTHIHWDPENSDVKLVQTMIMMKELKAILGDIAVKRNTAVHKIPLVVAGDFNSLPNSAVYEYITKGRVIRKHPELKGFRNVNLDHLCCESDESFYRHSFKLEPFSNPESLRFTNYTTHFKGTIDYIFISTYTVHEVAYLGAIDWSWIQRNHITGFPHVQFPSDHIPLFAKFGILDIDRTEILELLQTRNQHIAQEMMRGTYRQRGEVRDLFKMPPRVDN